VPGHTHGPSSLASKTVGGGLSYAMSLGCSSGLCDTQRHRPCNCPHPHHPHPRYCIPCVLAANAAPLMTGPGSCTNTVRQACSPASPWLTQPLMFGLNMGSTSAPLLYVPGRPLPPHPRARARYAMCLLS
jgi:hypothetical protein